MRVIAHYLQVDPLNFNEGSAWLPITPINMAARSATAISVILISLMIAQRWRESCVVRALASTGRIALTHYLAHTTLVLGPMFLLGYLDGAHTRMFSVWMSLAFFACAVTFSVLWSKRYNQGPLEYIMRRMAD
jgi:uncharacterized protein